MKKYLIVLLAAIMMLSFGACAKSAPADTADTEEKDAAATENIQAAEENDSPAAEEEEDAGEAEDNDNDAEEKNDDNAGTEETVAGDSLAEAFRKILENNETNIKSYGIQFDADNHYINDGESGDEEADTAMADDCVALTDLNGDDVPELMYIASTDEYREGFFRIWHYDEQTKRAALCEYKGQSDYENNYAAKDGPFMDRPYAAGTRYIIYTGKDKGIIHIVSVISDTSAFNESYTYKMDENGNMELLTNAVNIYGMDPSDSPRDEYYVDGKAVSTDRGSAAFAEAGSDFGELIMFSGYDPNLSAFSHIKTARSHAISYEEAIDRL